MKIYWKVLSENRMSAMAMKLPSQYHVHYPVGEWVSAPIGGLFVFENRVDAESFVGIGVDDSDKYQIDKFQIVKCHIKESKKSLPRIAFVYAQPNTVEKTIKRLWNWKDKDYFEENASAPLAYGTVFADEVKCLE